LNEGKEKGNFKSAPWADIHTDTNTNANANGSLPTLGTQHPTSNFSVWIWQIATTSFGPKTPGCLAMSTWAMTHPIALHPPSQAQPRTSSPSWYHASLVN
jgi:hypothetical protein